MHLQRNAVNTLLAGKLHRLGPVRNDALLPLPGERFAVLRRPVIDHPIRHSVSCRAARTAGETNHGTNPQHAGELQGLTKFFRSLPGLGRIRIQCVVVAARGHDRDTAVTSNSLLPGTGHSPRIRYQLGTRTVRRAIRTSRTDLDRLNAQDGKLAKTPMGRLFLGAAGLSGEVDCAAAGIDSGAEASAAAVVPKNCLRFMKCSKA